MPTLATLTEALIYINQNAEHPYSRSYAAEALREPHAGQNLIHPIRMILQHNPRWRGSKGCKAYKTLYEFLEEQQKLMDKVQEKVDKKKEELKKILNKSRPEGVRAK